MQTRYRLITLVAIISFLLSGCGSGQLFGPADTPSPTSTGTSTPTITPIPTATITPTPTITPTSTPGPETMDRPLSIMFSNPLEDVIFKQVVVNGAIMVDETAYQAGIRKVVVTTELGGELLFEMAFRVYWYHGNTQHEQEPTDQDRNEFREKLLRVQKGELPCSEIQAKLYAYDAQMAGDRPQKMPLEIFCGLGNISDSVRKIGSMEIVYVKGHANWNGEAHLKRKDMPRFCVWDSDFGDGYETEVDGTTLRFKVGLTYLDGLNRNPVNLADRLGLLISWIRGNSETCPDFQFIQSDLDYGENLLFRGLAVRFK